MLISTVWLRGGGNTGRLIREKDWRKTSLGPIEFWPQSLRTTLGIVLNSRFPMFLYWGSAFTCFYNDAAVPLFGGKGKEDRALGNPAREVWPELWNWIGPLFERVLARGESWWNEDELFSIFRNGRPEDAYGTFSYSPVNDESGRPAGILVAGYDTTEKVTNLKKTREREDQLNFIIEAAELGTWDLRPQSGTFTANQTFRKWFGLPDKPVLDVQQAIGIVIPEDQERVRTFISTAIESDANKKFEVTFSIPGPDKKKPRMLRAQGKAYFDMDGSPQRFIGTLEDITTEVLAQEELVKSEENFRRLIESAPVAMCVFHGPKHTVGIANQKMLELWGRPKDAIYGRPIFDALPDAREQGLEEILDKVYNTGVPFAAHQRPVKLPRKDGPELLYINFVYQPIKNALGQVSSIIAVASDVTDQVMTQQQVDKRRDEVKRQMLRATIDAQEKEREYISNELHDNVNQLLAGSKLFIEMIECRSDITREYVAKCSEYLEQSMQEIRNISHGLNPSILRFVGLSESVRGMTEKLNLNSKTEFNFQFSKNSADQIVNRETELSVFRIIQTQVANILKHANAKSAKIVLNYTADFLELIMTDNGIGFDMVNTARGLGLLNIISRIELLNGTVSIVSAPGEGCKLTIRIPARLPL